MANLKVLVKLQEARKLIKNTKLKKAGENKFSKYKYFTPEQVESLVSDAAFKTKIFQKFDLKEINSRLVGTLTVYDLESEDFTSFEMVTDVPVLKATNTTQQLGGAVTYTERYLKMTAFGIVDNSLDFDANESKIKTQKKALVTKESLKNALTQIKEGKITGEKVVESYKAKGFELTAEQFQQINKTKNN